MAILVTAFYRCLSEEVLLNSAVKSLDKLSEKVEVIMEGNLIIWVSGNFCGGGNCGVVKLEYVIV